MEKYCPDARPGYREKANDSLKYIMRHLKLKEKKKYKKNIARFRNKCLIKVKKKYA